MLKRIKLSPFLKNIASTSVASAITVLSIIALTRILAQGLGEEEFGAYSLARRMVTTIIPFSSLMVSVSIARSVGLSKDERSQYSYFLSGLILVTIIGFAILATGLLFRDYLTSLIYHSQVYVPLFLAAIFMVVGFSFYTVLGSFYRGQDKIGRFNLWYIGLQALGPLAIALVFVRFGRSDLIVFLLGLLFYLPLIPLSFHVFKALRVRGKSGNKKLTWKFKELSRYGLPRMPAGFALAGLFSIGPFLSPYFGSIEEAGYFVIGQSVFRVFESGMIAFGIVALPRLARLSAEGQEDFLRESIADMIAFVFHIGLFVALHTLLWSDQIILLWLGPQYMESTIFMRVLLIGLVPYLMYIMLRSVIDAVEEKAINTLSLLVSLAVAFVSCIALAKSGLGTIGLAAGTTLGYTVLGILSIFYLWKLYRFQRGVFIIVRCLLLNALIIAICFFIRIYWIDEMSIGLPFFVICILMECLASGFYLLVLYKWRVSWMSVLKKRIFAAKNIDI